MTGILNELEKAHIYIQQLHRQLEKNEELIGRLARMEELETRPADLEGHMEQ